MTTDDLRRRYAEALIARLQQAFIIDQPYAGGMVGQPFAATEYDLADAVLAIRDDEIETLRGQVARVRALLAMPDRPDTYEKAVEDARSDCTNWDEAYWRAAMDHVHAAIADPPEDYKGVATGGTGDPGVSGHQIT